MKSVLITGANGYIGRHVVEALNDLGALTIAVDRSSSSNSKANVTLEADIFDPDTSILDKIDELPDACLHLAWRNGFNHNDPSHMEDLSGHYAFLTKLVDAGVKQLSVMGSMHEIGYWEGAIDANTPCNPQSLYAVAKNALREALQIKLANTSEVFQWIRGYYIYGDDEASQSIFGKLLRAEKDGQTRFPFTSGKNKYDFLSVDELALQIAQVVMQDKFTGIINCCSGNPITLAEMVESFIQDRNLNIKLEYGAFPDRPYDSPGVWGDASIIKEIAEMY